MTDVDDQLERQGINVKALTGGESGDWILDVRGVPYGSPVNKDLDGEYFAADTQLHEDKFPLPPATYYHGITEDGRGFASSPEYIGKTVSYEDRPDGRWYRVVLDKSKQYAQRVYAAAQKGLAFASSGSNHLARVDTGGHIREWPVLELALLDLEGARQPKNKHAIVTPAYKAMLEAEGWEIPDILDNNGESVDNDNDSTQEATGPDSQSTRSERIVVSEPSEMENVDMAEDMTPSITPADVTRIVADALKADREAQKAEQEAQDAQEAAFQERLKAEQEKWQAEAIKAGRLPEFDGAPAVIDGEIRRYDNLDIGQNSLLISTLEAAGKSVRPGAYKALAMKAEADEKENVPAKFTMKALRYGGFRGKANELNYSTQSSYGDEWVTSGVSNQLWLSIRQGTFIANQLPVVEFPAGVESLPIPLESTDPTFYKMAQTTGLASATDHAPAATVTSSKVGTAQDSLTLVKMGARTLYSGEMEEDSMVPWVPNLMRQLETAGMEQFEGAIIDGDTASGASANVNDIAGTPAGTEYFMLVNGPRKLALVTNTANSRSGGSLDVTDVLETFKLMGNAGKNAMQNPRNTILIPDPWVYWKMLDLPEVKTRDVSVAPTIENGELVALYNHPIYPGWNSWRSSYVNTSYEYKQNSAGKVDVDTAANNLYGSLLAMRLDQWLLGYRRRMTIETTRFPESDSTQIVAQMRWGLVYRDTEAAAITYGLTV